MAKTIMDTWSENQRRIRLRFAELDGRTIAASKIAALKALRSPTPLGDKVKRARQARGGRTVLEAIRDGVIR
jgi:hypothetical protein